MTNKVVVVQYYPTLLCETHASPVNPEVYINREDTYPLRVQHKRHLGLKPIITLDTWEVRRIYEIQIVLHKLCVLIYPIAFFYFVGKLKYAT